MEFARKSWLWRLNCGNHVSKSLTEIWVPQCILFQKSRFRHICSGSKFSTHPLLCCRDSHASAALLLGWFLSFPSDLPWGHAHVLMSVSGPFLPLLKFKEHLLKWTLAFPWVFCDFSFLEASVCFIPLSCTSVKLFCCFLIFVPPLLLDNTRICAN